MVRNKDLWTHKVPKKLSPVPLPVTAAASCSPGGLADDYEFIGRHFMASYVGCEPDALRHLDCLEDAMRKAVRASGATLLNTARHVFPSGGATIVMLLSESHASIHTYPEHGSCFVDLFTCGLDCRPDAFDAVLRNYLRPAGSNATTWIRDSGVRHEDTDGRHKSNVAKRGAGC